MKKIGSTIVVILALVFVFFTLRVAFRGELVQVPPSYIGKLKTSSGFEEGFKMPSYFRLPVDLGTNPTKLVLVETSDNQRKESIEKLFMPEDQLNLDFDVIGIFGIRTDDIDPKNPSEASLNNAFRRLTPQPYSEQAKTDVITFDKIYETYGQQQVRTVGRELVTKYGILYVMSHREEVSQELETELRARLSNTPLVVLDFGLGEMSPPDIIINAQVKARERQIANDQAEAQKQIDLIGKQTSYQVELVEQEIDTLDAETQVLVSQKLAAGVTPAFVAQRSLRLFEALAESPHHTFVLPLSVLQDPASLIGLSEERIGDMIRRTPTAPKAEVVEPVPVEPET